MRRWVVYLLVTLSAFGLGSFAVFKFYCNNPAEITKESSNENNYAEQSILQNTPNEETTAKFGCDDEFVKPVWNKLEKNDKFMADTRDAIKARHISNCQELFDRQTADLNGDKSQEIILRGIDGLFCGSSGDCPTWIVSKIYNEYVIIFEGSANESPDGLQFLSGKTHGFKNIKIKLNNGWATDDFGFFKFDGKRYRITKCFEDVNSDYDYDSSTEENLILVKSNRCL